MPNLSMFDLFSNELLEEVLQYLTTHDILYAFKRLNKRIDILLEKYPKYDLNFKSLPKSKFDFVCQSISPEQIRSLILSNGDDTCREINLFFQLFNIRKFVNLKSLTLIEITEQDLNKIVTELNLLSKLSYLSIKLENGLIPQINIPSLKSLSIGICSISQLRQVLLSTPLLTNLNVQLISDTTPADNTFLPATEIRQLKIELVQKSNLEFDHIEILFEWMPKLNKLTFIAAKIVATETNFIRGDRWEYLIRKYLPQLKEFHFRIHSKLCTHSYINHSISALDGLRMVSSDIERSLLTFRTPFWLKEKKWFINCDHHYLRSFNRRAYYCVHFYTLPFCDKLFYLSLSTRREANALISIDLLLEQLQYQGPISTKMNVFKDDYSTIKNLYLSFDSHSDTKIAERYYFSNLDSLTIRSLHKLEPIDNLINLSKIKHLTIKQNNKICSKEFLSYILVHSNNLESLELSWTTLKQITANFTNQHVCSAFNKQIKYLNLLNMIPNNDEYRSILIINKIFSTNLEKLSLSVSSMDYIPLILNKMSKLYSVKIECHSFNITINEEELSLWLMKNVPRFKNFSYRIRLATETTVCLLLWIGD